GRAADADVPARPLRSGCGGHVAAGQLPESRPADRSAGVGGAPLGPVVGVGHAGNFLYILTGQRPSPLATRAFDVALVLHADHELNASTFAARVAAATLTDLPSAIVAAIGALKGPLHGGANADVMRMLIEIGPEASGERIDEAIRGKLAKKVKIPGFGHRVYH